MDVKDVLKKGLLVLELKLERCDPVVPKKEPGLVPRVLLERYNLSSENMAVKSENNEHSTGPAAASDSGPATASESGPATSSDDVCWGCLEEGDLKEMHAPFSELEDTYADLISYCFSIQVIQDVKSSKRKFYICSLCIRRLQEAVKFKRQLEIAQSFFNKLFLEQDGDTNQETVAAAADTTVQPCSTSQPMNTVMEINDDDVVEIIDDDDDASAQCNTNSLPLSNQPSIVANGYYRSDFKESDMYDTSNINAVASCRALDDIKMEGVCGCPFCERTFVSLILRRLHLRTAHGSTLAKFTCEECGQAYKTSGHLSAHVRNVHLLLRPFRCHECDAGFFRKEGLNNHMYKHTKEKSFKCDGCQGLFGTPHIMRRHRRTCPSYNALFPNHYDNDSLSASNHTMESPYTPGTFTDLEDHQIMFEREREILSEERTESI